MIVTECDRITGIVGSNPPRVRKVCPRFYLLCNAGKNSTTTRTFSRYVKSLREIFKLHGSYLRQLKKSNIIRDIRNDDGIPRKLNYCN
jgi:hypothetical protein